MREAEAASKSQAAPVPCGWPSIEQRQQVSSYRASALRIDGQHCGLTQDKSAKLHLKTDLYTQESTAAFRNLAEGHRSVLAIVPRVAQPSEHLHMHCRCESRIDTCTL